MTEKIKMLVSLIIPVYNAEKTLDKCLQSIICQTMFDQTEIVLVDDGSKDQSGKKCDDYAFKFKNIIVIHQKNKGVLSAREAGVKRSSSQYIMFVDSDDWVENQYVEHLYRIAVKEQVDVVVSSFVLDDGENDKFYHDEGKQIFQYRTLDCVTQCSQVYDGLIFNGRPFERNITASLWAKLFKRDIIIDVLEDVDKRICIGEDASITYPAIMRANKIGISDAQLYHYYQNLNSMTHRYSPNYPLQAKLLYMHLLKYNKLQNRYDFTEQIEGNYISLLVSAISNLFQNGAPPRKVQIKEISDICKDKEVDRIMSRFDFSKFALKEKIVCILLKYHQKKFLWIYEESIRKLKQVKNRIHG